MPVRTLSIHHWFRMGSHHDDFLNYECEFYLKQPQAPSQRPLHLKSDLEFKLACGQLSQSLEVAFMLHLLLQCS